MKNKIVNFLKKIFINKWFYYIGLLLIAFLSYYIQFSTKYKNMLKPPVFIIVYLILSFLIICIAIIMIVFNDKKKKVSYEKMYLIFALVLGSMYLVFSPVFSQSDESFHFIRAFQVSKGHFISPVNVNNEAVDFLPESIFKTLYDDDDRYPEYKKYSDYLTERKINLDKENVVESSIRASNYIFINYLPHAIGIKIAYIFNLSPYYLGLFGRITNMLICIFICYLAIKITPFYKRTFTFFMLTPTVLAYMSSLSADGIVNSMSLLFIAYILKLCYEKNKLTLKNYIILLLIILFVSTCKVCYLPLIGLVLLIPCKCFKSNKNKYLSVIGLIGFGLLCSYISIKIGKIDVADSMVVIPLKDKIIYFVKAVLFSTPNNMMNYISNIFAGNYLYQNTLKPYEFISISYLICLYQVIINDNNKVELNDIKKYMIVAIMIVVYLLISYALYFGNTTIGNYEIIGIQGRYFIPIVLLIPLLFSKTAKKVNNLNEFYNVNIILNMFVVFSMLTQFII